MDRKRVEKSEKLRDVGKIMFKFVRNRDGTGLIETDNGEIETPAIFFCATKATIKGGLFKPDNTQGLFCNGFLLRDRVDLIRDLGGIHSFMGWNRPIYSDSGGFQIFSLAGGFSEEIKGTWNRKNGTVKILEEGVKIRMSKSYELFTAEKSVDVQTGLGVDVLMSFDQCTSGNISYEETKEAMERSIRWEQRSLDRFKEVRKEHQAIYGIVQGGIYEDLRNECLDWLERKNFNGIAIGGSLGKTDDHMDFVVKTVVKREKRPIHLLGIGRIKDLMRLNGLVDTFDCVEATRLGRHGTLIRKGGYVDLNKLESSEKIDDCGCEVCKNWKVGYLKYLKQESLPLCQQACIFHNMYAMNKLMEYLRSCLRTGRDPNLNDSWLS